MGKIQSNLFRIDTISSESTTNSTDSEPIHKICNVVYRMLTQKLFGKVKQVKEGVTIRRNETTINMNEQMDFVIPASKISSLQAGTLVGQVALDFGQEDNFPTAMYHCKTNLDLKKIKKEEEAYKELPKVYNFGTADNREKLLQKNFKRIYDEVETVIEQYV